MLEKHLSILLNSQAQLIIYLAKLEEEADSVEKISATTKHLKENVFEASKSAKEASEFTAQTMKGSIKSQKALDDIIKSMSNINDVAIEASQKVSSLSANLKR